MRLSDRLPRGLSPAALLEPRLAADVIDLSCGNPSQAGLVLPELPLGATGAPYEASAQGPLPARQAIAEMLTAWGRPTCARDVFLSAGTSEALSFLLKAVCNPGDFIVTARPGYPLVEHIAELEGVGVRTAHSTFDGTRWALDVEGIGRLLAAGARMVVLVTPNNPTGTRICGTELRRVAQLCRQYEALCVLDEVFAPFGSGEVAEALAELDDFAAVVSLGGLSKAGLWPGLKVSWMVLAGDAQPKAQLGCALEWIADAYLSVSQPIAAAVPALVALGCARRAVVRQRIARNAKMLDGLGALRVLPPEAGWYAPVRLGASCRIVRAAAAAGQTPAGFVEDHAQVRTLSGSLFDLPWDDALVLSLLAPEGLFEAGVRRLVALEMALPRHKAPGYSVAHKRPRTVPMAGPPMPTDGTPRAHAHQKA